MKVFDFSNYGYENKSIAYIQDKISEKITQPVKNGIHNFYHWKNEYTIANKGAFKLGAVLTLGGILIASGYNEAGAGVLLPTFNPFLYLGPIAIATSVKKKS
jgi:hypothetical protein